MIADKYVPYANDNARMTQVTHSDMKLGTVVAITISTMSVNIWFEDGSRLYITPEDIHSNLEFKVRDDG